MNWSGGMKRITLNLIAIACAIAAPQLACAEVTCPPTPKVQQKAGSPDSDWNVTYSSHDTALAGVTIFDGPPANQASLVPDREQMTKYTVVQTWKLVKSDAGYWLECEYANTTAQISRRLPANVSRCDVTYERNVRFGGEGRRVVKSVSCK
jgi:hypothetical protein